MQTLLTGDNLKNLTRIGLTGVAVLVVAAVCYLLILGILRLVRVNSQREHPLQLTNLGNVLSTYHLSIDTSETWLSFRVLMNDIPLVELPVLQPPAQPSNSKRNQQTGPIQSRNVGAQTEKLAATGKAAASTAGVAASLLGTLGGLLPGSAGRAMKEQSSAIRGVQTKAVRTMDAPEDAKRKMDAIQKDGSRLGIKTPARAETSHNPVQTVGELPPSSIPAAQPVAPPRFGYWVETTQVKPGESIQLKLRITPKKRFFKEGSYTYTLTSQQIPLQELNKEAASVIKPAVVHLKPADAWRYWLRFLTSAACCTLGLLALVFILSSIWK